MHKNNASLFSRMNYAELAKHIEAIEGAAVIGSVSSERFPLYRIRCGQGMPVLLSGAVHGDEPAGAHALVEFFRNHSARYEDKFAFTAFPCVNPWGFEHEQRGNEQGLNLNREFKEDTTAEEIKLMLPLFSRYRFAMDLHESWTGASRVPGAAEPDGEDPNEFFMWEICKDKEQRVGATIIQRVRAAGLPICTWPKIFNEVNTEGVIAYPEAIATPCYAQGTSFDAYSERMLTEHSFTIETSREWPLEKRVLADIISITTMLEACLESGQQAK